MSHQRIVGIGRPDETFYFSYSQVDSKFPVKVGQVDEKKEKLSEH